MNQCILCNEKLTSLDNEYCIKCKNDRYRRMIDEIHATIGLSGYTLQEIAALREQISQYKRLVNEIYHHQANEGQCDCRLCAYHKLEIESSRQEVKNGKD